MQGDGGSGADVIHIRTHTQNRCNAINLILDDGLLDVGTAGIGHGIATARHEKNDPKANQHKSKIDSNKEGNAWTVE